MSQISIADDILRYAKISYSPDFKSDLNTIDLWTPENLYDGSEKIWVIYLHGGAWRDPDITSFSFEPAVRFLSQSSSGSSIAGFASINYRLSSYPSHPINPSSPNDKSRDATHPLHLQDVSKALIFMEQSYQIARRYLIAGHSAGATIAFQLGRSCIVDEELPQPVCILGIAGIYDISSFLEAHLNMPIYREIIENAFPEKSSWETASPSTNPSLELAFWENADALVIACSTEDELVEANQAFIMLESLRKRQSLNSKVYFLETTGSHDIIWQSGKTLALLIEESLRKTHSLREIVD